MRQHHIVLALITGLAILATGCEWLDPSCPSGYWRRRAGEACTPIPRTDAGPALDGGPSDAGHADAAAMDGGIADAAIDAASSDASAPDASVADAGPDAP
jgi:hypothetical protein